jgi:hypothetical protein
MSHASDIQRQRQFVSLKLSILDCCVAAMMWQVDHPVCRVGVLMHRKNGIIDYSRIPVSLATKYNLLSNKLIVSGNHNITNSGFLQTAKAERVPYLSAAS